MRRTCNSGYRVKARYDDLTPRGGDAKRQECLSRTTARSESRQSTTVIPQGTHPTASQAVGSRHCLNGDLQFRRNAESRKQPGVPVAADLQSDKTKAKPVGDKRQPRRGQTTTTRCGGLESDAILQRQPNPLKKRNQQARQSHAPRRREPEEETTRGHGRNNIHRQNTNKQHKQNEDEYTEANGPDGGMRPDGGVRRRRRHAEGRGGIRRRDADLRRESGERGRGAARARRRRELYQQHHARADDRPRGGGDSRPQGRTHCVQPDHNGMERHQQQGQPALL